MLALSLPAAGAALAISASAAFAELTCDEAEAAYLADRAKASAANTSSEEGVGWLMYTPKKPFERLNSVEKWQLTSEEVLNFQIMARKAVGEQVFPGTGPVTAEWRDWLVHSYAVADRLEICYRPAALSGPGSVPDEVRLFDTRYPQDVRARHRRGLEKLQ